MKLSGSVSVYLPKNSFLGQERYVQVSGHLENDNLFITSVIDEDDGSVVFLSTQEEKDARWTLLHHITQMKQLLRLK